ncbi:hypothetical protein FHETE_1363 [Fusarium heterosporum]|uniref:Uncharacterized protein n=1 Tax=Fusarium heterosporum TaxID=42747 RepID=A0A8H5TZ61_FUSHE|nr:hypothetical protein FHETE_1363 [Fusarium heterosporum]
MYRNPPPMVREEILRKRRSLYDSLKYRIDEIMDLFRETEQLESTHSHYGIRYKDSIDIQQLLPYDHGNAPSLTAHYSEPWQIPGHRAMQSSVSSSGSAVITSYRTEDPWLERLDRQRSSQRLNDSHTVTTDRQVDIADEYLQEHLRKSVKNHPSTTKYLSSATSFPCLVTRPGSCPPFPNHGACYEGRPEPTIRFSLPPEQLDNSYWSESEDGASWYKVCKQRICRMKARASRYVRDAFALNEEEKAYFQARRGMRPSGTVRSSDNLVRKRKLVWDEREESTRKAKRLSAS